MARCLHHWNFPHTQDALSFQPQEPGDVFFTGNSLYGIEMRNYEGGLYTYPQPRK